MVKVSRSENQLEIIDLSDALFSLKGLIIGQNHHYLDNLNVIDTEPFKLNLKSYLNDYILDVATNPSYLFLLTSFFPSCMGPVSVPLNHLIRIKGPEKDKKFYEPKINYELCILKKMKEIRRGWRPPPIITDFTIHQGSPQLYIGDGTHRYEALKRMGYDRYYAIINFHPSDEEKLNKFLNSFYVTTD